VANTGMGTHTEKGERLGHALGVAFRYLNRRERTAAEVRSHLESQGLEEGAIDQALAVLLEDGYVDDARFARLLVHDKRELEEWGSERIRRTLVGRGVAAELIDDALQGEAEEGELARAVALLRRRFPSPPADRRERERALGVLLRKGFESELALDALAQHERDSGVDSFR
jgi:regulatory protein